jgi:outer membrane protein
MKKFLSLSVLALTMLVISNASFAQAKIGYISTEELIGAMPEAEKANAILQDYQTSLQQQGQDYYRELSEKDSAFGVDSIKLSPAAKELRRNDLIALYQKVQGWQQTMQQMIQEKSQTLVGPIRQKAFDNIKLTAKEAGYAYVLESTAVLVGPPGDDILPLVKKKMGIVDKTATPATAPKAAPAKPKG